MVEIAKVNGVNVYHYLTYLLEKQPNDSMSDEELDQMLQDRATAAGYDTIEEYIGETSKEDYREYFLYDKVLDYLVENAQITNN